MQMKSIGGGEKQKQGERRRDSLHGVYGRGLLQAEREAAKLRKTIWHYMTTSKHKVTASHSERNLKPVRQVFCEPKTTLK